MNIGTSCALALALTVGGIACSHGRSDAATPKQPAPAEDKAPPPEAEDPCAKLDCRAPEECIRFVGIGGPRIPLSVCGVPCDPQARPSGCPTDMTCVRMADGPTRCEREREQGRHSLPEQAPTPR